MAKPSAKGPQGPTEKFYRIVEHPLEKGATYRGYQAEVVHISDGAVVERALIGKPNLFEYAQTALVDLLDPRNHVKPVTAAELA